MGNYLTALILPILQTILRITFKKSSLHYFLFSDNENPFLMSPLVWAYRARPEGVAGSMMLYNTTVMGHQQSLQTIPGPLVLNICSATKDHIVNNCTTFSIR